MTSKLPDVESRVDLDDIDNETRYEIADSLASMHDGVMNELHQIRRGSRIDRWISIAGAVAALIAAAAALYPIICQYV